MAVLEVDEVESAVGGPARGDDVIVDESADVAVAQQRRAGIDVELAVEQRMRVEHPRLEPLAVGPGEPARMRELQPDVESPVVAHRRPVRGDERFAQPGDRALRVRGHGELVRVRAAVVAHRHRLAAPDELRAARAEPAPAAQRVLARRAVGGAVPALHRLNREAIADRDRAQLERRRQRSVRDDDFVDRQAEPGFAQVRGEVRDRLERLDLDVIAEFQRALLTRVCSRPAAMRAPPAGAPAHPAQGPSAPGRRVARPSASGWATRAAGTPSGR